MVRWQIRFTGRVQGVGFRATAQWIARAHPVSGWVRNEPDGSVLMVAEGQPNHLEAFLEAIRDRMEGRIRTEDRQAAAATGEFTGFEIRR